MPDPPNIVFSGLLPHPPIIVPAVGGARGAECRNTTDACAVLADRLVAANPEVLVLVSPHAPRRHRSYGIGTGDVLAGDLGAFGHAQVAVGLPNAAPRGRALEAAAKPHEVAIWPIPPEPLDHGAVVPLWFLAEAGWTGPTLLLSLPQVSDPRTHAALGAAVSTWLVGRGRAALVASGDMSHRVLHGAPGGYDPRGLEFDEAVVALVERGVPEAMATLDPALRMAAGEDVVDSCLLVLAATPEDGRRPEVLSYEHPFGVGYQVAVFMDSVAGA